MRVGFCLDTNKEDADSGKHKFFIRLAREFEKNGITIDNKNNDVFISMAGMKTSDTAKVNILRLDGLILNTRWDYKGKNKKIMKSVRRSDALIYQGDFCHQAYARFLGVKKEPFVIIPNGAPPEEFLPRSPENYFIANCKWRPHKRLKDIVKSFEKALKLGLDADLIITGKPDYEVKHPRIKYLGWQGRDSLVSLMSRAIASLHLSWLDWCPNSMVEAIVSNCPVIYSKSGGHTELANGSGIGIEDTQWDFNPCDLYAPPEIDRAKVAEAMIKIKKDGAVLRDRYDLDIKNVSKRYIDFFKKIL